MTKQHLPVHPVTGLTALAVIGGRAVYPVMGGSKDTKFELPDTLEGLTGADLENLKVQAQEEFKAVYTAATKDGKAPSDEELKDLARLDDAIQTIEAAAVEVQEDEANRLSAAEDMRKRAVGDESATDTDTDTSADEPADEGGDETVTVTDDEGNEVELEPALAAALQTSLKSKGTKFASLAKTRSRKAADQVKETSKVKGYLMSPTVPHPKSGIVTSADLAGAFEDMSGNAMVRSMQAQGGDGFGTFAQTLGTIAREFPAELKGYDQESLTAAIELATNERLLKSDAGSGSLLAAAGWCSPSVQLYDFLGIPDAGDLIDLPEVGMVRAGIKFPVQPDFGLAFSSPGFLYTEAEAIAQSTDKPCFEVPCVGFDEVRLDAIGLCITAGILQMKGFPEVVRLYIDGILKAHQHRISAYTIQKMLSLSIPVVIPAANTIGAWGALMNSIELEIEDVRTRQRMPRGSTMEVVLPTWAMPALRADLAYRRGANVLDVGDAEIMAAFAKRNARVQLVSDWQVGAAGQPGAPTAANGSTAITKFPSTIQFMVYPAGTFFRSMTDVIEVGNLYDQAQLKRNKFTALFTEDGIAVAKRGIESRVVTVSLDYNGAVGPEEYPVGPNASVIPA